MFKKLRKDESGQIMVFVALTVLALTFLWAMVVNIGALERERVRMQNAVDAATLSAAVWQARGYNILAMVQNLAMVAPPGFWFFVDTKLKSAVDGMLTLEKAINLSFGQIIPSAAAFSVAGNNGADIVIPARLLEDIMGAKGGKGKKKGSSKMLEKFLSLDLVEHKGNVFFWKEIHIPTPFGDIVFWIPDPRVKTKTKAGWSTKGRTWYAQGNEWDNGPAKTLRFVAIKWHKPPLGGFFGLGTKTICTIAEAQVYLNTGSGWTSATYEGGFPPQEGIWSILPLSRWPTFDAKLVPVKPMGQSLFLH